MTRVLRAQGWRVLRIWEHALTPRHAARTIARLRRAIDSGGRIEQKQTKRTKDG